MHHCSEAGKISVCLPATFVKSVRRANVSLHRYQTEDQATSKKEEKKIPLTSSKQPSLLVMLCTDTDGHNKLVKVKYKL